MKKAVLTLLLTFIFCVSCSICFAETENLVRNSGFEEASGQNASGWDTYTWENTGVLKLDESQKYSGSRSASIFNAKNSDTRFKQSVKVKGNTTYKLSCMIKTENVGMATKGANISVDGLLDTSIDIKGTNNTWEYVELYGKTSQKQNSFIITLGLGGYGSLNSGQAWFDDVKVEEVKEAPEGKNVLKLYMDEPVNTDKKNSTEVFLAAIIAVLTIFFGTFLAIFVVKQRKTESVVPCVQAICSLKVDAKDIVIMICMTLIYASFTFFNLGSLKAPETGWTPTEKGQSIILDLGKEANVARVSYYWGLGSGKYKLEYLDKNNSYQALNIIENDNYDDIFTWNYIDMSVSTNRIKISIEEPGAELKEIAIFEQNNTKPLENIKLLNDTTGFELNNLNLLDEQKTAAYLPTYMNGMYFDEIYHARAGYEYIYHIQPYENTHPPLGKVFISLGIMIFGMNPFGWRIMGALFGALMIPAMYLFGRKIFKGRFYAFLAAFLMMFDFMHFTQTRIATIDTYVTLFVILMYYYMYDYFTLKTLKQNYKRFLKPLFLSGLFFGLGVASKWIAIYGAAGLALLFVAQKYGEYGEYEELTKESGKRRNAVSEWLKTILYCIMFFIIIPCIIYFLSYIPLMLVPGKGPINVLKDQVYMLTYHSKSVLGATHSFASKWWSWPILYKPMWYFTGKSLIQEKVSTIVAMGNPAIWWPSIPAVLYGSYLALKKRDRGLTVLIIAFIFQYVPWIYVKRLTFIYHFFSSIPFIILIIVYIIENFVEKYYNTRCKTLVKYMIGSYMVLVVALFVMFYPAISGMEVSSSYIESYLKWFKGVWFF